MKDRNIKEKILGFVHKYTKMDISGMVICCPYWMNRLKEGKVILRGFTNGKGSAEEIRDELIERLNGLSPEDRFELTPENLRKFAKREKIGIDCSGFVYRVLDQLVQKKYQGCNLSNLKQVFTGGIDGTNARILSSKDFCIPVIKVKDFRLGDMIRLWYGKHIAVIIDVNDKEIVYAHTSSLSTKIQGAHTSLVRIIDADKPLEYQDWEEQTREGDNFGKKRFNSQKGDGVFRLKIFS